MEVDKMSDEIVERSDIEAIGRYCDTIIARQHLGKKKTLSVCKYFETDLLTGEKTHCPGLATYFRYIPPSRRYVSLMGIPCVAFPKEPVQCSDCPMFQYLEELEEAQ